MKKYIKHPDSGTFPVFASGWPVILFLVLVVSCQQESDETRDNYLVNYRSLYEYPLETVESYLVDLVNEYPEAANIKDKALYGVQLYYMTYQTHYRDSVVTASGLVCLPTSDEAFPVISFQNGTNTSHANAPTQDLLNMNYLMLELMASNGYIILIPDYVGFGASDNLLHPYYHRTTTNNAVIDMMHAFGEMSLKENIRAAGNGKTYLMGYSQGGWATLSVLDEIENGEDAGIDVVAASCGAGAYDLMTMASYLLGLETYDSPLYLPYFIYSQQDIGLLQEPLDKFFNSTYAARIPELFSGDYSNGQVNAQLTNQIADLVTGSLISSFQTGPEFSRLRELLTENTVGAWNTNTKLHLYHGSVDQTVPHEQSSELYQDFINAGAGTEKVSYYELPGLDHGTGLLPWGILTLDWFNELEGK
jgi:pimeloyl-ACP methyl ester carboxylesterase